MDLQLTEEKFRPHAHTMLKLSSVHIYAVPKFNKYFFPYSKKQSENSAKSFFAMTSGGLGSACCNFESESVLFKREAEVWWGARDSNKKAGKRLQFDTYCWVGEGGEDIISAWGG